MKTRTSTTIEAGDLVELQGTVYLAATWDATRPCASQCSMYSHAKERCTGYCYRWDNGDAVVFRKLLPTTLLAPDTEVVRTPDLLGMKIEGRYDCDPRKSSARKYYLEKERRKRETKESRPYGLGCIYETKTGWRGEIYVGGGLLRKTDPDKGKVESWLDEWARKKEAMKKLEEMKKK